MLAPLLVSILVFGQPSIPPRSLVEAIGELDVEIHADYAVGLVTFSSTVGTPTLQLTPYVAIQRDNGVSTPKLRLACKYTGAEPLGTRTIIASVDGKLIKYDLRIGELLTTHGSGGVSERCDVADAEEIISAIAYGRDCYLTMSGTHDRRQSAKFGRLEHAKFVSVHECWGLVNRLIEGGATIHGAVLSRIKSHQAAIRVERQRLRQARAKQEQEAKNRLRREQDRIARDEEERHRRREVEWQKERERIAKRREEARRKNEVERIRSTFRTLSVSVKTGEPPQGSDGDWYRLELRNSEDAVDDVVVKVFGMRDGLPNEKLITLHARQDEVHWLFKWVKVSDLRCQIVSFDGYDVEDLMSPDAHNKVLRRKPKKVDRGRRAPLVCKRCGGTRIIRCTTCFGVGSLTCRNCAGTGKVNKAESLKGGYTRYKKVKCDTCSGKGGHKCKRCDGRKTEACPRC